MLCKRCKRCEPGTSVYQHNIHLIYKHIIIDLITDYEISVFAPFRRFPCLDISFGHAEEGLTPSRIHANQHAYFYSGIMGRKTSKELLDLIPYLKQDLRIKHTYKYGMMP